MLILPAWRGHSLDVLLLVILFGLVLAEARLVPFVPPSPELLAARRITLQPQHIDTRADPFFGSPLSRVGWTATADSYQTGNAPINVLDGNTGTMWHTQWTPTLSRLPHNITIDMKARNLIDGITYLPRQDGNSNGNIGQHQVFASLDGITFNMVAFGTWVDDSREKSADFEPIVAQFIRIVALTEAGNRGPWSSASEINVFGTQTFASRTGWTATADSSQTGYAPGNVLDGNTGTMWHTQWYPSRIPLPHNILIDMKATINVSGLAYTPRQDGNYNGNIGQYRILVSADGANFNLIASGTWPDTLSTKVATFAMIQARYIRLVALTEAGNRGPWSSASEINVINSLTTTAASPFLVGMWGPTIDFPIVPVAVSLQPVTGMVVAWSSWSPYSFGGDGGQTYTALYDPSTRTVTQRVVTNTRHDMFCPSISLDANGLTLVTGGDSSQKASIYNGTTNSWYAATNLIIPRGYHSSATCSDGRIFTIGGSWSGGIGGKNGEIYDPRTNTWSYLSGCPVAPLLTADRQGVYRADNHAWLFGWKDRWVFQAGPSRAMNWYGTASPSGSRVAAGTRAADGDSMCGNAVMYDALQGKILTVGGSPDYQGSPSTSAAHVITIGVPGGLPTVTVLPNMAFPRIFHNSVVLPDGKVFVVGGQVVGAPFQDSTPQFVPEMWNPATNGFTPMASNSIPRVYHSFALLLLDGTVLSGGGGLCGSCSTNHFDAQIFSPPYLFNPDGSKAIRPIITSVSNNNNNNLIPGSIIVVTTNVPVASMSLIRYGSSTHTVNTDQRRIPLTLTPTNNNNNSYSITLPNDYGILLPGYWMLFAMDAAGHPSIATTIQIRGP